MLKGRLFWLPAGDFQKLVLHSANGSSLRTIAQRLGEFGVDCLFRVRIRENKKSVHYQLEIRKSRNLKWFVGHIEKHSRLPRKRQYLTNKLIQESRRGVPR